MFKYSTTRQTCRYTTWWNTNAEKWHHSEIRIAINDESQGSIAKNLRCDESLYYAFIIHSAGARIFTAQCYASAVLAMALCLSVCLSVHPSVTSGCSTKTAKCRITQTTPHPRDSSFLMPKISTKFDWGHPLRAHQVQWGGLKSTTLDKSLAISQKLCKIDALKSNRKSYALYRMVALPMTLSDP